MNDPVTVERSDLFVLWKLATGHEPVEDSLIPFAVDRIEAVLTADRRPRNDEVGEAVYAMAAAADPELYGSDFIHPDQMSLAEILPPEPTFEDFYAVYPLKKKKPDALRAWTKAVKRADPRVIFEAATAWRAHWDEVPRSEMGTYPGYPASWLNGDCWDDEIPPHPRSRSKTDATRANLTDAARAIEAGRPGFRDRMAVVAGDQQRELEP